MKLKIQNILTIKRNSELKKAIAALLFVKRFHGSVIKQFSINKFAKILKIHHTTAAKYFLLLKKEKFIELINTKKGYKNLLLKRVQSHSKFKNVNLENIIWDNVKTIARSLDAIIICLIQNSKDFQHFVRKTAFDPDDNINIKIIKFCRRICKKRGWTDANFNDDGISISFLSLALGCHTQKVNSIIKFAQKYNFLVKANQCCWVACEDAPLRVLCGIDFVYAKEFEKINNQGEIIKTWFGYKVKANKYSLTQTSKDFVISTIPHAPYNMLSMVYYK